MARIVVKKSGDTIPLKDKQNCILQHPVITLLIGSCLNGSQWLMGDLRILREWGELLGIRPGKFARKKNMFSCCDGAFWPWKNGAFFWGFPWEKCSQNVSCILPFQRYKSIHCHSSPGAGIPRSVRCLPSRRSDLHAAIFSEGEREMPRRKSEREREKERRDSDADVTRSRGG